MNKSFLIVLIVSMTGVLYSQDYFNINTPLKTIYDKKLTVNSYYLGNNPAYLFSEKSDEKLSLKTLFNNENGNFKKFSDPYEIRNYEISASGKKMIDSNQVFQGRFSFQRDERNKWEWIFTKEYDLNPFLIGDSTTGNSRFNGINLEASYAAKLFNKISVGFNLNYLVDEALKQVSPRPTSEHREIDFSFGMGYQLFDNFSCGFKLRAIDKNEQIVYAEDEGAKTKETILFKFKGYDFPTVIRKKSEQRYLYHNNYSAAITFEYKILKTNIIAGFIESGFGKTIVKENSIDPKAEGFWKIGQDQAGLQWSGKISNTINAGIKYQFIKQVDWASYPKFNILYRDRDYYSHQLTAGIEYLINDKITLGLEAEIEKQINNFNDYYSNIYWKSSTNLVSISTGIDGTLSEYFRVVLTYNYQNGFVKDDELHFDIQSVYFLSYYLKDIQYALTNFSRHAMNLVSVIDMGIGGQIYWNITYSMVNPSQNNLFNGTSRKQFYSNLELRIQVY